MMTIMMPRARAVDVVIRDRIPRYPFRVIQIKQIRTGMCANPNREKENQTLNLATNSTILLKKSVNFPAEYGICKKSESTGPCN
jgi:hypothetical protein